MKNRDEIIVRKMLTYCQDIVSANLHFENDRELFFDEDQGRVYRNAVSMPILQIGELAKHLSDEFISEHSLIPWKEVIRMRDFFAHHYGDANYTQIWNTAHRDIEELKSFLLGISK